MHESGRGGHSVCDSICRHKLTSYHLDVNNLYNYYHNQPINYLNCHKYFPKQYIWWVTWRLPSDTSWHLTTPKPLGIIWCPNILLKAYVGTLKQIQQYFEMTLPPPSSSRKSLEISQKLFCWDKNPSHFITASSKEEMLHSQPRQHTIGELIYTQKMIQPGIFSRFS